MKILFCSLFLLGLSASLSIAEERSVHLQPTTESPVIGAVAEDAFLIAPADPVDLSDREREEGWEAISFLDDFNGFVKRSNLSKDLEVTSGSRVYTAAAEDSDSVITRAGENDIFEVERLSGNWAEVSFRKPVTGFILADDGNPAPREAADEIDDSEALEEVAAIDDVELAEEEAQPEQHADERQRPASRRSAVSSNGMLRSFQGQLSEPRTFFGRKPPYPFQIVDSSGSRIAYVDLSKLLITTPMEHFLGRPYEFYGKAEPIEGRRDFVIRVERMYRK